MPDAQESPKKKIKKKKTKTIKKVNPPQAQDMEQDAEEGDNIEMERAAEELFMEEEDELLVACVPPKMLYVDKYGTPVCWSKLSLKGLLAKSLAEERADERISKVAYVCFVFLFVSFFLSLLH